MSSPESLPVVRSSSQAPGHWNPGDVPHCQQHLGTQHRLSQVLLLHHHQYYYYYYYYYYHHHSYYYY